MLDDVQGRLEVSLRHAPHDAAQRLLASLGVSWRIDPNAPRCERQCGEPACRKNLSLRELDAVRLLVDERTRERGLPRVRERVDRQIEHGMRVVREPRDVTLVKGAIAQTEAGPVFTDRACRAPEGCENRANAKWERGALAGLCYEVHVPKRREELRANGRAGGQRKHELAAAGNGGSGRREHPTGNGQIAASGPPGLAPWKPPVPAPAVESDPVGESPSFADVAEALEAAREHLEEAESAYRIALERFAKHPVYVAIRAEIDEVA